MKRSLPARCGQVQFWFRPTTRGAWAPRGAENAKLIRGRVRQARDLWRRLPRAPTRSPTRRTAAANGLMRGRTSPSFLRQQETGQGGRRGSRFGGQKRAGQCERARVMGCRPTMQVLQEICQTSERRRRHPVATTGRSELLGHGHGPPLAAGGRKCRGQHWPSGRIDRHSKRSYFVRILKDMLARPARRGSCRTMLQGVKRPRLPWRSDQVHADSERRDSEQGLAER